MPRKGKGLPTTRRFGRKKYRFYRNRFRSQDAKGTATRLRKQGWRVRLIRRQSKIIRHPWWEVWRRR